MIPTYPIQSYKSKYFYKFITDLTYQLIYSKYIYDSRLIL